MKKRYCFIISLLFFSFINFQLFCSNEELPPNTYKNGIVVTTHELASKAGMDILKKGGNAVDAAVAVAYVLAVVYPRAGNIGGGGFMVIRTNDGTIETTIDYREKAPGKAHKDMYLDENGKVKRELLRYGPLAAGVPGVVAGTLYALDKYGTMTAEEVIKPAVKLAEEGWILQAPLGGEEFKRFESTGKIFNKPDGSRYEKGERFKNTNLAETLKLIGKYGRDGFYKGTVADKIIHTMQKYGGIISYDDLLNYTPVERKPVKGTYKGHEIVSMPPPSSGGITLIEMLNILEKYDLKSSGWNTAETVHLMVEAQRRAFADRNMYIADPDFTDIPVKVLISKRYADYRAENINFDHKTSSTDVSFGDVTKFYNEGDETTHYSIVDKNRMAVSVTTTIDDNYGCFLAVEDAGFLLNNEMADFSAKVGAPTHEGLVYGEANCIEPGKRMLSSMTPTIVTKDGKNYMVIGSPGGPTIINTVLQCILNVIEFDKTAADAVKAPRFHSQWIPDRIDFEKDRDAFGTETIQKLIQMGHKLNPRILGNAQAVVIDAEKSLLMGGPDPRRLPPSSAKGY